MPMQIDPLNSPHPVPWSWILASHAAAIEAGETQTGHYRTPSLRSPLKNWSAYSHIRLEVSPDLAQSHVSSLLLVENLDSGTLQPITASSPVAQEFWSADSSLSHPKPGLIAMLLPIAWDKTGTQLLAREFEGVFCSSIASDYAVVWNSNTALSRTLAPHNIAYERAILQGWSRNRPEQVLFKTARLGDPQMPLWSVDLQGQAYPSAFDQAESYGDSIAHPLSGPMAPATRLPGA